MSPADFATLRLRIKVEEDLRLKPYVDSAGKMTIGYGRNLTDSGITQLEAADMLENDLQKHISDLYRAYPYVETLDGVRQIVLADMCFNLGIARLSQFVKMWDAVQRGDFVDAAREMLDSKWARQVGQRAVDLAVGMERGAFA